MKRTPYMTQQRHIFRKMTKTTQKSGFMPIITLYIKVTHFSTLVTNILNALHLEKNCLPSNGYT